MGASFGVLPGHIIQKLYDDGRIWSESKPEIGTSEMDLTVSVDEDEVVIGNGHTERVELGQRITGKFPRLGQVYMIGQGRSSSAKAGADIRIVDADGEPIQPGYRGSLYAEITARGNHPVGISPGDPIADLMFCVGNPKECVLDPLDVMENTHSLLKDQKFEIDDKKLVMRLGLMNGAKPVGYSSRETGETAWLRKSANRRNCFFDPIVSCGKYKGKDGGFLLLVPSADLCIDPKADVPFIARMMRYNRKGMQVNLKDTIRFGSRYHRTVMEVPVTGDVVFRHGDPICEMAFYRMYERPKTTYNRLGGRNNNTITGTFFY